MLYVLATVAEVGLRMTSYTKVGAGGREPRKRPATFPGGGLSRAPVRPQLAVQQGCHSHGGHLPLASASASHCGFVWQKASGTGLAASSSSRLCRTPTASLQVSPVSLATCSPRSLQTPNTEGQTAAQCRQARAPRQDPSPSPPKTADILKIQRGDRSQQSPTRAGRRGKLFWAALGEQHTQGNQF